MRQDVHQFGEADLVQPLAVEAQVGAFEVDEWRDLLLVAAQVVGDVGVGERRQLGGATGRIADLGGDVTDDEDDVMAHALEAGRDDDRHRVAQVNIRGRRVDAVLDHERSARRLGRGDLLRETRRGGDDVDRAAFDQRGLLGRREVGQVQGLADQ